MPIILNRADRCLVLPNLNCLKEPKIKIFVFKT